MVESGAVRSSRVVLGNGWMASVWFGKVMRRIVPPWRGLAVLRKAW